MEKAKMLSEKDEQYLIQLHEKAKEKCKDDYKIDIETELEIDTDKSLEENRAILIQSIKTEKEALLSKDTTKKKEVFVNPFNKSITTKEYKHILKHLPSDLSLDDCGKDLDYHGIKEFIKTEWGLEIPLTLEEEKERGEVEEAKAEKENLLKMREAEKETIQSWKKQFNPDMIIKSPAYFEMEKFIEMVCDEFSNFCIVHSKGGLAKTWSSQAILKKKKVDYAYLNSFTSPLELYNFLYDNSAGKVILIDDCEGIWDNKPIISILKNATELNGDRTISWNSTTSKLEGRANTTGFNSRIILLTNQLPNAEKNPHIQALLSRAFLCKLKFSHQEKIDILQEISKRKYQNLSSEERKEIFEYIDRNTNEATKDLSIRTLIKCYHFYMFDKNVWKKLAATILKADEKKELVLELISSGKSVNDQIKEYNIKTGRSRADYFRVRRELKSKHLNNKHHRGRKLS